MPPRGSYTPQIPHISRPPGEVLVGADETRLLRAPVVFSFRGLQPVPPEALREGVFEWRAHRSLTVGVSFLLPPSTSRTSGISPTTSIAWRMNRLMWRVPK